MRDENVYKLHILKVKYSTFVLFQAFILQTYALLFAMRGKTEKTVVLSGFFKIDRVAVLPDNDLPWQSCI